MKTRILVVEDDAEFRELLSTTLSKHYEVDTAATGQSALEKLQTSTFDLVVLDVMLPGLTGIQLLETVRGDRTEMPDVILSTGLYSAIRKEAELQAELGVRAVLQKPYTVFKLKQTVQEVLAEREMLRSLQSFVEPQRFDGTARPIPSEDDRITLKYETLADFLEDYVQGFEHAGTIFIPSAAIMAVGRECRLRLLIPSGDNSHREVLVEGEVSWVRTELEQGAPGVGVRVHSVSELARRTLQAAAEEASQAAKTGRPVLILASGADEMLSALRASDPHAQLRVRDAAAADLESAASAELPDVVILNSRDAYASDAIRELKRDPRTGAVPILVCGPDWTRHWSEHAGADKFFSWPEESEAFCRDARGILERAQRRQHVRVSLDATAQLILGALTVFGRVIDIAEGGIGVEASVDLARGAMLSVEVPLPGAGEIRSTATVCWVGPADQDRCLRFGLEFKAIDAATRARIRAWVTERIQGSEYHSMPQETEVSQ